MVSWFHGLRVWFVSLIIEGFMVKGFTRLVRVLKKLFQI